MIIKTLTVHSNSHIDNILSDLNVNLIDGLGYKSTSTSTSTSTPTSASTITHWSMKADPLKPYCTFTPNGSNWAFSHNERFEALSSRWPGLLFQVDGDHSCGDEPVWRKYFKNGKSQWATPIIGFSKYKGE